MINKSNILNDLLYNEKKKKCNDDIKQP